MSEVETAPPAAEDAAPEIVSAFPLPPAFFVLYRDGVESGPPPPATMEPQYHMFGTPFSTQDVVPDLLPQPGQKLYLPDDAATAAVSTSAKASPDVDAADVEPVKPAPAAGGAVDAGAGVIDFKRQLKHINHSLLANFMELVTVLIQHPALFNEKLADLELLFLNMHNLINAFRPHQARETIIHMLQTQIQERRDAAHDIRKTIDESRRTVEDVHGELHDHAIDEMRSQDAADIKMEEVEDVDVLTGGGEGGSASTVITAGASAAQGARGQGGDLSAKAGEVQQQQDAFFSTLQTVAGLTQ